MHGVVLPPPSPILTLHLLLLLHPPPLHPASLQQVTAATLHGFRTLGVNQLGFFLSSSAALSMRKKKKMYHH